MPFDEIKFEQLLGARIAASVESFRHPESLELLARANTSKRVLHEYIKEHRSG